jgi:hypothetical protein
MRSNDEIPEDEMLLAEAYAAARENHMGHCTGYPFAVVTTLGNKIEVEPDKAEACCALGALALAGRLELKTVRALGRRERKHPLRDTWRANDSISEVWGDDASDYGESYGWAFRCAMTQDISDPETERIIRERSGK